MNCVVSIEHRFDRTPDGGAVIALRTAETSWLRRLMWQLGSQATVLEPAELAREVRQGARAALDGYVATGGSAAGINGSGAVSGESPCHVGGDHAGPAPRLATRWVPPGPSAL